MLKRRDFMIATGTALAVGMAPRLAVARAATDRRFVFVIQRGAADGLHIVAPVGDPAYAAQRGALAQDFASAPRLDAMFALHPAMANSLGLYRAGEALFVHAVASPYRDRSHFDGQHVLETGGSDAYRVKDGWMNRMLSVLPPAEVRAIAIAATVPMALRGKAEVASYAPSKLPGASDDLLQRVSMLYQGDAQLHGVWEQAMATRALTGDLTDASGRNAAATGELAARLLKPADGARIAMIETGGWDTHAAQRGRLAAQLKGLDAMLAALKTGLGPLWADTLVVVATEFGRTVKVNGTQGTDHGTASCAMLFGGAVQGGRVIADWPGLGDAALYQGRDLRPTTGLDAVIGHAVSAHFALDAPRVMRTLFPEMQPGRFDATLVRSA